MWHIRHNYNRPDDTTVSLQVTARCQRWARPVPWWQPMKIPWWYERLRDQNCFVFCKTYWKWKRMMGFTLWCCLQAKFNFVFESNFWLVSSFWKLLFPFDWDLYGEYRQPIAQVGGVWIYSPRLGQIDMSPKRPLLPLLGQLQYIPRNMHMVLLCFALLWLCNRS